MPGHDHLQETTQQETTQEDEIENGDEGWYQGEVSGTPSWRQVETFFSFIAQEHLKEAQEFREKGHNSQIPEVDPDLLPELEDVVATIKSRIYIYAKREDQLWLLTQIEQLERFISVLSGGTLQDWVTNSMCIHSREGRADKLEGRATAQSQVRRLELTLQALLRTAKALGAVVDYSTAENLKRAVEEELFTEATNAIASNDEQAVAQALERMKADIDGNSPWSVLVSGRVASKEADKAVFFETLITATRRAAAKANKNARELSDSAQTFFSEVAAYLQSFSGVLSKLNGKVSKSSKEGVLDSSAVPKTKQVGEGKSEKGTLRKWVGKKFEEGTSRAAIIKTMALRQLDRGERRSKTPEAVMVDSIIRSILWQCQQPAIKIQSASEAILLKAKELKKIAGILDVHGTNHEAMASDHQNDADLDAQVIGWVQAYNEQERPENKTSAKLVVLGQLFDSDIASARKIVRRFSRNQNSVSDAAQNIKDEINHQFSNAIKKMINEQFDASSHFEYIGLEMSKFLPEITDGLAQSVVELNNVIISAERQPPDFSDIKCWAKRASLSSTKVKEKISTQSASLTGKPLDDNSRGALLAKYWASLAQERGSKSWPMPDAGIMLAGLREHGLLKGTVSSGDPNGYLLATRLAGEVENANNDELKLPMSADEYAALEKSLVEFIVRWGQRRTTRGTTRLVVELGFEQAIDTAMFSLSNVIRMPYKVLKASIMIPYKVNKARNYILPGQDKPYKAIRNLLVKKLSQLGLKLITTPVPGVMKYAVGGGLTVGAMAYNRHVKSSENTVDAIYDRLVKGAKSRVIKMDSKTSMLFDVPLDAMFMVPYKGIRKYCQSIKSNSEEHVTSNALVKRVYKRSLRREEGVAGSDGKIEDLNDKYGVREKNSRTATFSRDIKNKAARLGLNMVTARFVIVRTTEGNDSEPPVEKRYTVKGSQLIAYYDPLDEVEYPSEFLPLKDDINKFLFENSFKMEREVKDVADAEEAFTAQQELYKVGYPNQVNVSNRIDEVIQKDIDQAMGGKSVSEHGVKPDKKIEVRITVYLGTGQTVTTTKHYTIRQLAVGLHLRENQNCAFVFIWPDDRIATLFDRPQGALTAYPYVVTKKIESELERDKEKLNDDKSIGAREKIISQNVAQALSKVAEKEGPGSEAYVAVDRFLKGEVKALSVKFKGYTLDGVFAIPLNDPEKIILIKSNPSEGEQYLIVDKSQLVHPEKAKEVFDFLKPTFPKKALLHHWKNESDLSAFQKKERLVGETMPRIGPAPGPTMRWTVEKTWVEPYQFEPIVSDGKPLSVLAGHLEKTQRSTHYSNVDAYVYSSGEYYVQAGAKIGQIVLQGINSLSMGIASPGMRALAGMGASGASVFLDVMDAVQEDDPNVKDEKLKWAARGAMLSLPGDISDANTLLKNVNKANSKLNRVANVLGSDARDTKWWGRRAGDNSSFKDNPIENGIIFKSSNSSSKKNIGIERISKDISLISAEGSKAKILYLDAHGGYEPNATIPFYYFDRNGFHKLPPSGTVPIPPGKTVSFKVPHGYKMGSGRPDQDLLDARNYKPFTSVEAERYTLHPIRNPSNSDASQQVAHMVPNNPEKASKGTTKPGELRNYDYTHFKKPGISERGHQGILVNGVDRLHYLDSKTPGSAGDVITINPGSTVPLERILDQLSKNPKLQQYDNIVILACRSPYGRRVPTYSRVEGSLSPRSSSSPNGYSGNHTSDSKSIDPSGGQGGESMDPVYLVFRRSPETKRFDSYVEVPVEVEKEGEGANQNQKMEETKQAIENNNDSSVMVAGGDYLTNGNQSYYDVYGLFLEKFPHRTSDNIRQFYHFNKGNIPKNVTDAENQKLEVGTKFTIPNVRPLPQGD